MAARRAPRPMARDTSEAPSPASYRGDGHAHPPARGRYPRDTVSVRQTTRTTIADFSQAGHPNGGSSALAKYILGALFHTQLARPSPESNFRSIEDLDLPACG